MGSVKTLEEVSNELNEVFVGDIEFKNEDEMNWYFAYDFEEIKVRKSDYALHFRIGKGNDWNYDFDLF